MVEGLGEWWMRRVGVRGGVRGELGWGEGWIEEELGWGEGWVR